MSVAVHKSTKEVFRLSLAAVALTVCAPSVLAASVWKDAVLWFNGPVDANNDGKWTGNVTAMDGTKAVPRQCDGTGGATCEMPDARHGALASSISQKLNYSTGSSLVYEKSGFQIRTNDVHFTAWGNKTAAWPCIYLPQAPSGGQYVYSSRWALGGGEKLITSSQWTVLFRCRIEDFCTVGGSGWLWCTKTDTSRGGTEKDVKEIRFGFGRNGNNTSDTTHNYVKLCFGNGQSALTDLCVETNEWLEVAITVDGRADKHSVRASLGRPGAVRWYRNFTVPYSHSSHTTNFYPNVIYIGGPRYYGNANGNDNFRGDIQMLAMWNRCLSDREVCEAFGGGSPSLFRLGEDECTAEMYGGAAPASGATVTLDPLVSDKRAFPTTLTKGATFRIPFTVDKYAANAAHWVRFRAQSGSAGGTVAVALDGEPLPDMLSVKPGGNAYRLIRGEKFTVGSHVLTLSRSDSGSGDVKFDVIELGGAWSAGVADSSVADATSNSTMNQTYLDNGKPVLYASDTWYPDSLNLREFVRYAGRNKSGSMHRAKTVVWNLPEGAAGKFGMNLSYNMIWAGDDPLTNSLVTTVNGTPVHTNSNIRTAQTVSFEIPVDSGALHDGENTIVLDFLPCTRTDQKTDWVALDMLALEPLPEKKGMMIIVR